jgi:hypothetical protein
MIPSTDLVATVTAAKSITKLLCVYFRFPPPRRTALRLNLDDIEDTMLIDDVATMDWSMVSLR